MLVSKHTHKIPRIFNHTHRLQRCVARCLASPGWLRTSPARATTAGPPWCSWAGATAGRCSSTRLSRAGLACTCTVNSRAPVCWTCCSSPATPCLPSATPCKRVCPTCGGRCASRRTSLSRWWAAWARSRIYCRATKINSWPSSQRWTACCIG